MNPQWPPPPPPYVFLSSGGYAMGNLYTALVEEGIPTIRDNEKLELGCGLSSEEKEKMFEKTLLPQLCTSIEESKLVIVIISINYLNSSWCLEQVAKAVECNKLILPVFDDVDPIELRLQQGSVAEAFFKHKETFKDNPDKVRKWREAINRVPISVGVAAAFFNNKEAFKDNPDKARKWREAIYQGPISVGWSLQSRDESQAIVGTVIEELYGFPAPPLGLLFLYCSLFPEGYEFRKHELVQLWIAQGFDMREHRGETMEDAGIKHFNTLESQGFFVRSGSADLKVEYDEVITVPFYVTPNFFYKVNPSKLSLLEKNCSSAKYFRVVDGKFDEASESSTQHMCLNYQGIDEMAFGAIKKFKNLRTLLLLPGCESSIKCVPADLFLSLEFLRTLNLSGTLISRLPGSIGDVLPLRYIDLSRTPISRLPESICSLDQLQTLKLRGCNDLFDLPKSMHKLTALRHLDFNISQQLSYMPPHLGRLNHIQTLSTFLVGTHDGHRIQELKNLNDLTGALRILNLENVLSTTDVKEAYLTSKKHLQRLDLQWISLFAENTKLQEDIIDSLRPPSTLKELNILSYSGSKLPSWLSHRSFADLIVITLDNCAYCELFPSLGQLPALKFLSVVKMNAVKEIDQTFFRSAHEPVSRAFPAFPKLEILEVDTMPNLKEWKEVKEGDLPSLLQLKMECCPQLVTLPSFLHLKSLKYLKLIECPKLVLWDHSKLPTSLESLIIGDCCELKSWCRKEGDQELQLER
ncbi:putative disease resistance RPP13-like protein 1 [Rosa sericea]